MKGPVQALLWEQWRRTWKVIPFTFAIGLIILWMLPEYFIRDNLGQWSADVGVIMCCIICGIFCMLLQSEGGARGGTIANRHFVLPVSSLLLTAVPVFVLCMFLLGTLVFGAVYVNVFVPRIDATLSQSYLIGRNIVFIGCFVLAYSLTLGMRDIPVLRMVLTLLVMLVLANAGHDLSKRVPAATILAIAIALGIPMGVWLIGRDRHQRAKKAQGNGVVFRPIAAIADRLQRLTLKVPRTARTALLWNDLRGGGKLLLPVVIAASGIAILSGVVATERFGGRILRRLNAPQALMDDLFEIGLVVAGVGLLLYIVARVGARLVGSSNLFAPWAPEASFWKRQPVSEKVLGTVKVQSILLQCLFWSLGFHAVLWFVPLFAGLMGRGFARMLDEAGVYLVQNGLVQVLMGDVARPLFMTTLFIWTFSGMIVAIGATGRKWFVNFGFVALTLAALAVVRVLTYHGVRSLKYEDLLQQLRVVLGVLILLFSFAPLVWTMVRGHADRLTLVVVAALFVVAEMVIVLWAKGDWGSFLMQSLYALPFAPLGLLPLAVKWGRRL